MKKQQMSAKNKFSLTEIETDALLRELGSRFDHCVFSGLKAKKEGGFTGKHARHGDHIVLMGLCADQIRTLGNFTYTLRGSL